MINGMMKFSFSFSTKPKITNQHTYIAIKKRSNILEIDVLFSDDTRCVEYILPEKVVPTSRCEVPNFFSSTHH
jgi:hypothetical protein